MLAYTPPTCHNVPSDHLLIYHWCIGDGPTAAVQLKSCSFPLRVPVVSSWLMKSLCFPKNHRHQLTLPICWHGARWIVFRFPPVTLLAFKYLGLRKERKKGSLQSWHTCHQPSGKSETINSGYWICSLVFLSENTAVLDWSSRMCSDHETMILHYRLQPNYWLSVCQVVLNLKEKSLHNFYFVKIDIGAY